MTKVTHLTIEEGGAQNRRRVHLREISGDMESPLETVGQDLRAARLRRGDDLASVSRALKIRKDHLEALEEDRVEYLPGRTYAVGFVRSYAEYLGLDVAQTAERFKSQIAGRTAEPSPAITIIDEDDLPRLPHGWKIIAALVAILFLYGAYELLMPIADKILSPPVAPVPSQLEPKTQPARPLSSAARKTAPPRAQGGMAAGLAVPAGPTQPAQANTSGSAGTAAQPGAASPGLVYGQAGERTRVVLRVRKATRILVQGPGGAVLINRTLNAGDTYMVPDRVGLTLTAADAGAVEVDLDGVAMGVAGRSGQVGESVSLDPQAIVDRYNRRRSG
jgi:cytoskeleton protein RodZ